MWENLWAAEQAIPSTANSVWILRRKLNQNIHRTFLLVLLVDDGPSLPSFQSSFQAQYLVIPIWEHQFDTVKSFTWCDEVGQLYVGAIDHVQSYWKRTWVYSFSMNNFETFLRWRQKTTFRQGKWRIQYPKNNSTTSQIIHADIVNCFQVRFNIETKQSNSWPESSESSILQFSILEQILSYIGKHLVTSKV